MLVALLGVTGQVGVASPAGMTERAEQQPADTAPYTITGEAVDATQLSAGATGARVATAERSGVSIGQLIALRPAS